MSLKTTRNQCKQLALKFFDALYFIGSKVSEPLLRHRFHNVFPFVGVFTVDPKAQQTNMFVQISLMSFQHLFLFLSRSKRKDGDRDIKQNRPECGSVYFPDVTFRAPGHAIVNPNTLCSIASKQSHCNFFAAIVIYKFDSMTLFTNLTFFDLLVHFFRSGTFHKNSRRLAGKTFRLV